MFTAETPARRIATAQAQCRHGWVVYMLTGRRGGGQAAGRWYRQSAVTGCQAISPYGQEMSQAVTNKALPG